MKTQEWNSIEKAWRCVRILVCPPSNFILLNLKNWTTTSWLIWCKYDFRTPFRQMWLTMVILWVRTVFAKSQLYFYIFIFFLQFWFDEKNAIFFIWCWFSKWRLFKTHLVRLTWKILFLQKQNIKNRKAEKVIKKMAQTEEPRKSISNKK